MDATLDTTYTYTARSADKASKALTFTIRGDRMSTDLGPPLERVGQAGDEETSLRQTVLPMITPAALWAMEQGFNTFHLRDVEPHYNEDGSLMMRMWVRVGGLRAFPIHIGFGQVDNPDAAHAFAQQIDARKDELSHPGPFTGLLDYWFSWAAAAIAIIMVLNNRSSNK